MRNFIAAAFGLGMFVATSAYADHFPGSNASGYEVQTPQSVNESGTSRPLVGARDSQPVYHPGHTPSSVNETNPAGSNIGATRSDRAAGTARSSDGYSLFGMRFSNPAFPSSVNESAPWQAGR